VRIWSITNGVEREAYRVGGVAYKCFPKSSNISDDAREFSEIEEAAKFLVDNPGWGIRMNPGTAIIFDGINIALD
jgi:hypothetical protein